MKTKRVDVTSRDGLWEITKRDKTYRLSCDGKYLSAWRVRGGYVLMWEGFECGRVAPRDERPCEPYFERTTISKIEVEFDLACGSI